ncbi:MAG: preprotein translocase subunit SecY [Candidatus Magasanikbacteria bacterium CG11_big_fil_rev_8_21_14_0_20_39_34]|uniref:Protein translocase subunit SecY n=1 Tax=Candidatus Magasanikbacteria bacterium CG11_big_fil_rev_8_21_14_0_20_39_34 TaxID=1974653 RepID=A0A2H0N3T8_9BACT|nr:MAG: preprotein translocase subunit SecY [Candidatus Magasanikbacteria bacterium CG11_big_fil_rev_8_21_14_0_20_39_34]
MEKFRKIWKTKSLRNSVLYVIGMLVIFRAAAHIPVPGIDTEILGRLLSENEVLGLLNVFSGGTIKNFSLVMLGVAPYITASIIFQLLNMVVPYFEELSKEGEMGQRKLNMYTRITSVPLAMLQAFGLIKLLSQSNAGIFGDGLTTFRFVSTVITATVGTIFLMWIGELISEKKIGNGISILIFAGIIAALPGTLQNLLVNYNPSEIYTYVMFLVVAIVTVVAVVFISEGQRNVPVNYARSTGGRGQAARQSHLPLRINMAGVIPIIFAISLVLFPPMVAQFFIRHTGLLGRMARLTVDLFNNQLFYGILYFVLVFGFTYFYTAVIFKPQDIAENLQRQGGFIPGIRPGKQTEDYLNHIMSRLVFSGALFLAVIAILPLVLQAATGTQSLALGGTGLLIVVSVAIDITRQIDAQITMHEYDRV